MRKIQKDYALSLVRLCGLLMVVFCHICQQIGYTHQYSDTLGKVGDFLAAGVQIFLILSGILYGKRKNLFEKESRVSFVLRNFGKILLDYYVYVFLVIFPVYYFLSPESLNTKTYFKVLTCSGTVGGYTIFGLSHISCFAIC